MPKARYAIAACARWESEFIVEWLTYYQLLGYDHVYLYCNDDDPAELYERVLPFATGRHPFVTFNHWREQGQHRQMMLHFVNNYLHETEWVSFFDIDEFLRLGPDQTIGQFMSEFEGRADSVLFNWVFFGPNGHKTHPGRPVLSTYTRREGAVHPFTKHITRASLFQKPELWTRCLDNSFVHRIGEYLNNDIREYNILGESVSGYYNNFPDGPIKFLESAGRHQRILETGVIHHYAFRSEKAFFERTARGLKGDFGAEKMWTELAEGDGFGSFLENVNRVEDRSLVNQWERWGHRGAALEVIGDPVETAARSFGLSWPLPPIGEEHNRLSPNVPSCASFRSPIF
ncbi:MAG: glycosyltransferase family 2 protein [Acidiphilium sp.]